ncbi:Uracil-DNA glycosylase [Frankia sp. CcI6]|nr:Uracil-DNA glycosylase [Frankia sp. CcI6]OAA21283.1 uracil-DNA glycosylase [Frankia casuarinae]
MPAQPLRDLVEPGWAHALEPVAGQISAMGDFLRAEIAAGRGYLPAGPHVLRAFQQPFDDVRVLIVGQDPYPTPGMAIGYSFAVAPEVRRLPGSLLNIFQELCADVGVPRPSTGDLTGWTRQGVLLLNRALTTAPRQPGLAPGQRLGAGHRTGHPGAGRAGQAAGRDPVGCRGPQPAAVPGRCRDHRVRPPVTAVGRPGLLRVPAVQPGQRPPAPPGCRAGRLEPPVTRPPLGPEAPGHGA